MRFQQRAFGEVGTEGGVGGEVAAVEGEEEIAQPGMRGRGKGVEDGVQQELAEVVDGVGDQGRDAEVVGAGLEIGGGEGGEVDTGEVEEGVMIIGGEVVFCLWRVLV